MMVSMSGWNCLRHIPENGSIYHAFYNKNTEGMLD